MGAMLIRPGRPAEAAALSDLAMRSKSHWGYNAESLEACRADLTVSPEDCDAGTLLVMGNWPDSPVWMARPRRES